MEQILIVFSRRGAKEDLDFLLKREFSRYRKRYLKTFMGLTGFTFIVLSVSLFTNSNSFVNFKAVFLTLLALVWLAAIIILIPFLLKRWKRILWRNKTIDSLTKNEIKYYLLYDAEKITIITETYKSEFKWNYFTYYTENNQTLFIFNNKNIYEALSFSPLEIGEENLLKLKQIVQQELKPLPKV